MKTLLFITSSFPLSSVTEQAFVEPEVEALSKCFDRVVFLPLAFHKGHELSVSLPDNCEVDDRQAHHQLTFPRFREMLRPEMLRFLLHDVWTAKSKEQLKYAGLYVNESIKLAQWLEQNYLPSVDSLTIYTFWFDIGTIAAAMLADKYPLKIVTRAHRYDIYDFAVIYRSHYLRSFTLKRIQGVYPCSNDGTAYIRKGYPLFANKIHTAYLGSIKHKAGICQPNDNNHKTTFVSCSRLADVKRVPLIAESLVRLAEVHPEHTFEWFHIGGDATDEVGSSILSMFCPSNLTIEFLGSMENAQVHEFYVSNKVDWFVSMSSSEGLPISMCEALSYGLPIIATNVGGVSEIVTPDVGVLLSPNPSSTELADKLSSYICSTQHVEDLRSRAILRWQSVFDSSSIRNQFANIIAE